MTDTLIWAAVTLILGLTVICSLAPSARRALRTWTDAHTVTAAERQAAIDETRVSIEERRHKLAIAKALIAEETENERVRLEAETAQYATDRNAARRVLDDAIAARRKVIGARAEAEAALAPDAARHALEHSEGEWLAQAYAAYCKACVGTPWSFGQWIQGYEA